MDATGPIVPPPSGAVPPLAALAHELRTPLHGMQGLVALLRATALDAEQRAHVDALGEAADALLRLAEDALDLARLDAGRLAPAAGPCDPRALLAGVVRTLAPIAAARGLGLEATVDAAVPPTVTTDAGRLRQVLVNLAGNALKYTVRGAVRLAATVEPPAPDARGAPGVPGAGDGVLAIAVRDTGPGLAPAQQARLFAAWERLDAGERPDDLGGAGLGLVLARALVHRLDGRLTLASAHGRGSTFTVRLPL